MDLLSDYYPYLDVKAKSVDTIFRELCTNDAYRQIEDGTWKETFINRFGDMLDQMPDVRTTANRVLHDGMLARGYDIDPETLYFNTFTDYVSSSGSGSNNRYHLGNMLKESYRLTDAALLNLFEKNYGGSFPILQGWYSAGIYKVGKNGSTDPNKPEYGNCWGPHNSAFLAIGPAEIVANTSIQQEYSKDYNAYWTRYSELYRDMLADFFLSAAIRQYKDGLLSEYGFSLIRKVYARQAGVDTYWLDINTYKATDIIVMESTASGVRRMILYIPGAQLPFVEFTNVAQLKTWIVNQLDEPAAMAAFLKHFSIYNRQDGPSYTGVDKIVKAFAEGNSNWNPQYYILRSPVKIPYDSVFDTVRNRVKAVMHDDAEKQITTDSELYRDYALGFVETLIKYTVLLEVIVPKVGIPLNIVLSATSLGLGADIAVNGDTLEQRLDGVGSLVNSVANIATNMLPILKDAGEVLKKFRRPAADILAFADENRFIMNTFRIESKGALDRIRPGDAPVVVAHEMGELRLVRLADGGEPLAVLHRVAGNKFVRLDPITLKELEGERLISEVLKEGSSLRPVYISGSMLRGGAPFNPFDRFFDGIWTLNQLKRKADLLGMADARYAAIKQRLGELNTAVDFDTKLSAAHRLLYQIADYKRKYPSSLRNPIFNQLSTQIKGILYPPELRHLAKYLIAPQADMHPFVATRIYKTSLAERLGEMPDGATWRLIKYAQEDPVLSVTKFSDAVQSLSIPPDTTFDVKYVIPDMSLVNKLDEDFTLIPPYASQNFRFNEDVFRSALWEAQRLGILPRWKVVRTSTITYSSLIGYSYDELMSLANRYIASPESRFSVHVHTVGRMIKDLLQGGAEKEMMEMYGKREYFETLAKKRLDNTERSMGLHDSALLPRFDGNVRNVFKRRFNRLTEESERLAMMMENPNGIVVRNGADEISYCLQNLDYFKEKGVTHIGLTDLFADIHQGELSAFMGGGFLSSTLEAMILLADKGVVNGPMSQLLTAARGKGIQVVALGNSDTALHSLVNVVRNTYNQSLVVENAVRLLGGKKAIVIADIQMIHTIPGLSIPVFGIAQTLAVPGFLYSRSKNMIRYYSEIVENRVPLYFARDPEWRPLAPASGRFLGWRVYGDNYELVTPLRRREIVYAKVQGDLAAFKREYEEINNLAAGVACAQGRSCDRVMLKVRETLAQAGKKLGTGRSLSWWHNDRTEFVKRTHTAATVYIQDVEYVVDASHLQFRHDRIDESVMMMLPEDWAEEILSRVKAYNPFMADRGMAGNTLWEFSGPDFTRPKV